MQAHRWIQNMERGHKIIMIPYDDPDFLRKIRNCVEFGIPALMEIGDKIDFGLEPLLYKQAFYLNDKKVIRIGDKIVAYNDNFRLYLTTILVAPNFSPEITSQVNLLDFSITASALEEQLLSLVIKVIYIIANVLNLLA
jgi:dynein heavy chain